MDNLYLGFEEDYVRIDLNTFANADVDDGEYPFSFDFIDGVEKISIRFETLAEIHKFVDNLKKLVKVIENIVLEDYEQTKSKS